MSDTGLDKDAIEATDALDLAKNPIEIIYVNIDGRDIPLAALYKGVQGGFTAIDLKAEYDKWLEAPERRAGVATALTLQSFSALVNRHKDDGSAVFANIVSESPALTAVIDYHELDGSPRFGKHRVVYKFPISEEWKKWIGVDGKSLPQQAFAEWLEDRIADLASATEEEKAFYEPKMMVQFGEPNEINILARGLTINVNSVIANATTLQSGEGQIVFQESHTNEKGQPLKVPGLFIIAIPLFFGGETIRVPVRLRYRKAGGSLTWSFALYRPNLFVKNALENDLEAVAEATKLPLYEGAPES